MELQTAVAHWQFLCLKNPGSTPGSGNLHIFIFIFFPTLWMAQSEIFLYLFIFFDLVGEPIRKKKLYCKNK